MGLNRIHPVPAGVNCEYFGTDYRCSINPCVSKEIRANTNQWRWIWRLQYPQKLRLFVWLLIHGRLAVNMYRNHIGATTSSWCDRCHDDEESILHMLRDCPDSRKVWEGNAGSTVQVGLVFHEVSRSYMN